jgi:hypothetical protein
MPDEKPDDLRRRNKSDLDRVQREASKFVDRLAFTTAISAVTGREQRLTSARADLQRARQRGYPYKPEVEAQLDDAARRAPDALTHVRDESARAARDWRDRVNHLVTTASRLDAMDTLVVGPHVDALETEAKSIDQALDAAEKRIAAVSDPFTRAFDGVEQGLRTIHQILDHFEQASFKLNPGEDPIETAGATWEDPHDAKPKAGRLFFTNQRVRFEQDEDVVVKAGWFGFGGETQKAKKLHIDEPIGHLSASDDSTRGWVMKDQLLAFAWSTQAKFRKTTFKLGEDDAADLDKLVEGLRASEPARVTASAPVNDTPMKPVPSKCRECAGALPPPVKGQVNLECPYCGTSHDLRA